MATVFQTIKSELFKTGAFDRVSLCQWILQNSEEAKPALKAFEDFLEATNHSVFMSSFAQNGVITIKNETYCLRIEIPNKGQVVFSDNKGQVVSGNGVIFRVNCNVSDYNLQFE